MYMKENEVWAVIKEVCLKNNLNFYDTIVFVLDQKRSLEDLLDQKLDSIETVKLINQAVSYIISENLFKM